jgi:hypothetical protein
VAPATQQKIRVDDSPELMPMTKNNDNPTSTLCENKKLLTIKLKLVTLAISFAVEHQGWK